MGLFACFSAPQVENGKLEDILEDNYQNGGHGGQIGQMEDVLRNGGHLTRMVLSSCFSPIALLVLHDYGDFCNCSSAILGSLEI